MVFNIKSIYIGAVDCALNAEYITETFYCLGIATIHRVTLVPFTRNALRLNRAYIDIREWHPTESAYNFIQRLRDTSREARIVHRSDKWWAVEINRSPSITTNPKMAAFTTINYLAEDDKNKELMRLPWVLSGVPPQEEEGWKAILEVCIC